MLVEGGSAVTVKILHQPNVLLYNIYFPIEFGLLAMLLLNVPAPDRRRRRLTLLAAGVFAAVLIWDACQGRQGSATGLLAMAVISGGLLLAFLGLFAALALSDADVARDEQRADWWILASVCLYFVSCTPIFGLMDRFMATAPERAVALMGVNDVLFVIRYAFMGIAFLQLAPRRSRP